MPNSSEDKRRVVLGILRAWVLSTAFIWAAWALCSKAQVFASMSLQEILALTFILPALSLAMGIGWAARTRHVLQNIDGSAPAQNSPLDITLRYTQNTTEQIVLFILMVFCLSGALPDFSRTILPILGVWFFIARMLFWAGYQKSPTQRATGFAATFHPTLIFLAVSFAGLIL